jgi:cytochrome c-type biogenesis protein CcmF
MLFIGGSLALFAWRAPSLKQGGLFAPVSREGALILNNLFLTTACATVFIGTLYPLALEAVTGDKISVGAPFFNLTFGPLFVPLLLAMPFGPLLAWKRGDLAGAGQRLLAAGGLGMLGLAVVYAAEEGHFSLAPFGIGLAIFVMAGAATDLAERIGVFRVPFTTARARARGLPRSTWGSALAHFGVGMTLFGIVSETHWGLERIVALKPSETAVIRHYHLTFEGVVPRDGPNYREQAAVFTVRRGDDVVAMLHPSKRSFTARSSTTTEAALMTRGLSQLYISLGDVQNDGSVAVRIYHKPLVLLIWLGAIVMAFGGALSLSDRRLRVGAPRPAKSALAPAE